MPSQPQTYPIEQDAGRTLVMKFGGTSVGTPAAMAQAVEIVLNEQSAWPRLVVVTSALSGVTNLLLDSAARASQNHLDQDFRFLVEAEERMREAHFSIAEALIPDYSHRAKVEQEINVLISEFLSLCHAVAVLGEATPRALDTIAALGERMSVRLLSAALQAKEAPARFVEANRLIITDSNFQNAHPDFEATREHTRQILEPLFTEGCIPVVTGFLAADSKGITTTLGRGGSDYSAAILGAVLPAEEVWIWTDVDGVMSADPRIVSRARTIPELTYREISELAYYGAKVLHPKTIRPVIEGGIGLRICNTFNPEHAGTWLLSDEDAREQGKIKSVTAIRGQSLITIEGRGMLGVPGVAACSFAAVASTGTSVPLITQASSEQSICFAVPVNAAERVVQALEKAFASELGSRDIDRVWATEEMVIVTVVGAGMRHTPGIAGKVFSALGENNVNVIAIAQGSSEVSISLVVEAPDAEAAVRAIHELITKEVFYG